MQSQLNEAIKANETLTKSYEAATGTYDHVSGIYDDIMQTKAFLNDSYYTVVDQYRHYKGVYDDLRSPGKKDFETMKELLEGVFGDPRTATPEQDRRRVEREYQIRQQALKKAIEVGEETLATMPDRVKKLNSLAGKIGKTSGVKEAQALTNSILLEILTVLEEQLAISLRFQQAMSLQAYSGITDESIAKRAKLLRNVLQRKDVLGYELNNLHKIGVTDITDIKEVVGKAAIR